ncbi:hypothetical protein L596_030042 [Steinernema carpocapsae]|uniref:Uncharacterized protein n=1 Tax=Steinernema carpocapsae TaxID=34508 RepID=A0A4U5LRK6_STECR|nr:hypothetical protein L596_030042 [Steinernema carpocapsae]
MGHGIKHKQLAAVAKEAMGWRKVTTKIRGRKMDKKRRNGEWNQMQVEVAIAEDYDRWGEKKEKQLNGFKEVINKIHGV